MSVLEEVSNINKDDVNLITMSMLGVDITEVYSPEAVTKVCDKFGSTRGSSMDLTNGWDFDKAEHRILARERVLTEEPLLVVGSPPCTYLRMLHELNKSIRKHDE